MKLSQLKQQIEELDASYFPRESKREKDKLLITHGPELLRRLLVAEEALDRIKRPVWWMQEDQRRKTGSINGVSGAQAVALSNDPNYLREIATAALAAIRGEEE